MRKILSISVCCLLAFAATAQSTLSVQGNASLAVKPTQTTVNLNIESKDATYPGAVESMINRVEQLSKDLKKLGFKDSDIITSNFNVNQGRVYVKNMWKDSGFVATQQLMVTFPQDKKKLLDVLNTVTKSSAKPSINLSFGLDVTKKEEVKNELIKLAVKDAKTKAEIIASASAYNITGIKSIEYGRANNGPQPMYEVVASDTFLKAANVEMSNFEAADLRYNETVFIVYTIEQ
ncbi:SIMPL domain-containing protein [Marinoscillum sp.]|uniref:SIMPL domain-containing protein n=1 Tax=Marinoscillum sp. TaxID=2024838 RepID=UPI003BA85DB5